MFGILISLIVLFIGIKYRRYFLLLVPFLENTAILISAMPEGSHSQIVSAMQGSYSQIVSAMRNQLQIMNLIIYAELPILISFSLSYKLKGKTSLFLFLYPLLSIPSLLFARDHLWLSIFLMLLLSLSSFLYLFCLKNMEWMLKKNIFNLIVLVWVSFGLLTKIFKGIIVAPLTNMSSIEFALISRGGGVGGSNYAAQFLFLFLPFIENPWILLFSNLFLLLTFSRGIYVLLILFWIIKIVRILFHSTDRMKTIKFIFLTCAVLSLLWIFLPINSKNLVLDLALVRIFGRDNYFGNTLIERILNKILTDERIDIWAHAITIFKKTLFQGVGLGGFRWGEISIGGVGYSDAHNLYLTLIVEGGICFFLAFLYLLMHMFSLAKRYSTPALIALIFFTIYGFYSGAIYVTSGIASAGVYYYLIFLLAYLEWNASRYSNLNNKEGKK